MSNTFPIEAINLYDTINIKGIRSLLSGKILTSSPQELLLQHGEESYVFIYRFGCVVFFNVAPEVKQEALGKLKEALGPGIPNPTSETYVVNTVDAGAPKVEFEYVEMRKPTLDHIRLICVTVGQSAAIEYFEVLAERMLTETTRLMGNLSKGFRLPLWNKRLLSIIGSTASTRQHIISNVSVLDPPEETWKSKELGRLHAEVQENFDIAMRFRVLDRKLSLVQDNIEILSDLTTSLRSTLLEALIVVLIVIELVVAFYSSGH